MKEKRTYPQRKNAIKKRARAETRAENGRAVFLRSRRRYLFPRELPHRYPCAEGRANARAILFRRENLFFFPRGETRRGMHLYFCRRLQPYLRRSIRPILLFFLCAENAFRAVRDVFFLRSSRSFCSWSFSWRRGDFVILRGDCRRRSGRAVHRR